MRRFVQIAPLFSISLSCLTQSTFPAPDPFSQTATQLIQSTSGKSSRINDFNSEFDSFGNRLIPLSKNSFIAPVNFESDYSTQGLGSELGSQYAINYTPILAISGDPYAPQSSIGVGQTLGPVNIQTPRVSYTLSHDSALQLGVLGSTVSAVSQILNSDIAIGSSPELAERFKTKLGYRPTITRFFEFPTLNTFDHRAFIQMGLEFQRMKLSYGGVLALTTRPSFLTGARLQSNRLGQTVQMDYDLNGKLSLQLSTGFDINKQSQTIVEQLGVGSVGGTTSQSLQSNVAYSLAEKISISSSLAYLKSQQETAMIATEQIGGDRTGISPAFGLAYAKSEKLSIEIGTGLSFNSSKAAAGTTIDTSYELSVLFVPSPSYEIIATIGSSTDIGLGGLGLATKQDFIRALLRKKVFRRTSISAAMEISISNSDSQTALAAAIGNSERTLYSLSSSTPIGNRATINLSYSVSSIETSTALLQRANTVSSISLSYRF